MGKQVAARSKKVNKQDTAFEIEQAWEHANLHQQGSAVKIAGFTSD